MKTNLNNFPKSYETTDSYEEVIEVYDADEINKWKASFEAELRQMLRDCQNEIAREDRTAAFHYQYILKKVLGES